MKQHHPHLGQRRSKPRNNFKTAFGYVVILIILVASALYAFYYAAFSRFAKDQAIKAKRTITENLCYSITEMNSSIRSLCATQFSLGDVQYLMHIEEQSADSLDTQRAITRLQHSISSNLYIHSALTYNSHCGQVYSTYRGVTDIDPQIKEILCAPNTKSLALTPIPRVLSENDYYSAQPVFSYIMYDSSNGKEIDCALVVNVKAEWLSDSLKKLVSNGERLIVFDSDLHQIARSDLSSVDFSATVPSYCTALVHGTGSDQVLDLDGEKTYVSVSAISGTSWYLLSEIPYDTLLAASRTLEEQLLFFSIFVFAIGIFASFFVVQNIYKPIKQIASTLQQQQLVPETIVREDDLVYISQALQLVGEQQRNMQKTTTDIVRENLLRTLLFGVSASTAETDELRIDALQVRQNVDVCTMALLQMDGVSNLSLLSPDTKKQLNDTLTAIITEAMPVCSIGGVTNVAPGEFIMLLNMEEADTSDDIFTSLQQQIHQQCGINVSLFRELAHSGQKPHVRFMRLQRLARYRMFAGPMCCLNERILDERETLPLYYPSEQIQAIQSAIKKKNSDEASALYTSFSHEIQHSNNYENFRFCVMQLLFSLQTLLDELSGYATTSLAINMDEVYSSITHAEYSSQIDAVFFSLIFDLCAADSDLSGKHSVLLGSVKEYIDLHYADKDLSLKQIAGDFSLSQTYLGKLFREYYGLSIKEYITQIRLRIAAQYLTQSSLSIKRIMDLSGFDNESNFYRIFRACYGVTPSSYRMNHSIAKASTRAAEDPPM